MAENNYDTQAWFIGKARSAAGYRKNLIGNLNRSRDGVIIGKMFFFYYDPKTKAKLPVYDRFPLVFPIEPYSDGFLGLNLHYLNPNERKYLLNKLSEYSNNNRFDKTTKLRLSYDLLSHTKKLATVARPCIKRYLFSHCRSDFIEITADEWEQAINLPVAMFVTKG